MQVLFSPRVNRLTYFIVQFVLNVVLPATISLSDRYGDPTLRISANLPFIAITGMFFSIYFSVKRSHDIGKSAWFYLVPWLAFICSLGLIVVFSGGGSLSDKTTLLIVAPATLYIIAVYLILLFKAGDRGDNAYGPPPPSILKPKQ